MSQAARKATGTRRAALDILTDVRKGELADRALARRGAALESRDYGWLQELVYGTFRLRGRIDHILAAFVRGELASLDPEVLDILRLGTYQLLEMGSVPAYAAVSQSVELAREAGFPKAAGFVNGVLQSVRRQGPATPFPTLAEEPVAHLTAWGSHPEWLVRRWVDRWGPAETLELVEANNARPRIYLRPVGMTPEEAVGRLSEAGLNAETVPAFPDSLMLGDDAAPAAALAVVPAVVQDPAAATVVRFCGFPPGSTLLDLSAAPGGKTVGLAETARFVAANDLSVGRLRRVRSNVERTGVGERVGLVVGDGLHPPFAEVDGVLLDAPCTGTGTLRRHPDGRWRLTPRDLQALGELQHELLKAAATVVRPGGRLVYSTCSIEPEENDEQVDRFLEEHPDFHVEPPAGEFEDEMLDGQYLRILPQRHRADGAFAARMKRDE